ncbi:unnamed protein product [marine sediment metagenome]|uniref:Uncharacterized protein n=1 Tax=marine sediment metagenome TaxID=412755 RepID=X1UX65_9ZZZZ
MDLRDRVSNPEELDKSPGYWYKDKQRVMKKLLKKKTPCFHEIK